jgi:hypothetical protein
MQNSLASYLPRAVLIKHIFLVDTPLFLSVLAVYCVGGIAGLLFTLHFPKLISRYAEYVNTT